MCTVYHRDGPLVVESDQPSWPNTVGEGQPPWWPTVAGTDRARQNGPTRSNATPSSVPTLFNYNHATITKILDYKGACVTALDYKDPRGAGAWTPSDSPMKNRAGT